MTIYISGAITGTTDYKERFEAAEHQLREAGYEEVINPAKISALLPKKMPWGAYMEVMLPLMKYCDAIYLLSGWENSAGARIEREYAAKMGMMVMEEERHEDNNPHRDGI